MRSFPMPRENPLDPPAAYAQLRSECPVAEVQLYDGTTAWLLTRYQDIRQVLTSPDFSSVDTGRFQATAARAAAESAETSFTAMDPPEHTRFRKLLVGHFTFRRVQEHAEAMSAIVDRVLSEMLARPAAGGARADLLRDFAYPVATQTMCQVVGIPYEDHEWFEERSRVRSDLDADPDAVRAATEDLLGYIDDLVGRRLTDPGQDLLSTLVQELVVPEKVTRAELVAITRLLLTAGHETSVAMIATGMFVLLTHPDQLEELRADRSLLPNAIEELLRYLSILHLSLVRRAKVDTVVGGCPVHADDGLLVNPAAANKDSEVFADPDRFDIRRETAGHIAFGAGVHHCLGQPVARLELRCAFDALLTRVPTLRLAVPAEEVPFDIQNLVSVAALPVTW